MPKKRPEMLTIMRYRESVTAAQRWCQRCDLLELAYRTKLNFHWLARFARGEVPDPKISKLHAIIADMKKNDA